MIPPASVPTPGSADPLPAPESPPSPALPTIPAAHLPQLSHQIYALGLPKITFAHNLL